MNAITQALRTAGSNLLAEIDQLLNAAEFFPLASA